MALSQDFPEIRTKRPVLKVLARPAWRRSRRVGHSVPASETFLGEGNNHS
jgi:hypothetical protein